MRQPRFEVVALEDVPMNDCSASSERMRPDVLVVDDERIIADTLSMILSRNNYDVMTAYDGGSALELARAYRPFLLITDVVMPGMTGVELALALEEIIPDIKVLLFSGQAATFDMLAQANGLGRHFTLLTKPVHPVDMLRRVSNLMEDSGAEAIAMPSR
jgi:CheY-like chemotaxis protein